MSDGAHTQPICGPELGLAVAEASTLIGLEAHPIQVEVSSTRGPSFFQMVGLAEAAVREARVRVASALARLGVLLDEYAITVNLAPADVRKGSAALDLAIAVGILGAIGVVPAHAIEGVLLPEFKPEFPASGFDMADVRGQATARRALEIAAAGEHNLLMMGPQTHRRRGAI
ncbi:MAG: magnesium chelatase domain-containing protein [Polyangiaceae bacterium]